MNLTSDITWKDEIPSILDVLQTILVNYLIKGSRYMIYSDRKKL